MGRALAFELERSGFEVVLVDARGGKGVVRCDVREAGPILRRVNVAISAVPFSHNLALTRLAIEARTHFCDLGGDTRVVRRQHKLHERARRAGVCVVPDCGLMPGLGGALAGEVVRRLGGRADRLQVRVGGLPVRPREPYKYQLMFSEAGLLHEYTSRARVLRSGRIRTAAPLTGVEHYGPLEAFHTGGSASTLPDTFEGRVKELDVKTIRYAGHAERVRRSSVTKLLRSIPKSGPDWVLMTVLGTRRVRTVGWVLTDRAGDGLSAMMRCTAFPASIVAQRAASGKIRPGVRLQERDVPVEGLVRGLRKRGLTLMRF